MISVDRASLRAAGPSAARVRSETRERTADSSDVTSIPVGFASRFSHGRSSQSAGRRRRATPARVCPPAPAGWSRKHGTRRRSDTSSALNSLAEHARADFAAHAGHRPAAQRAVNVHAAVGHDLGARADCARDDQIAMTRVNPLAGAHRTVMHERRNGDEIFDRRGRGGCSGRRGAGGRDRCSGPGRGFHGGDGRAIALLRAELGQDRQVELARQRFDRRRAVRQADRQHAGAADRTEQRAHARRRRRRDPGS